MTSKQPWHYSALPWAGFFQAGRYFAMWVSGGKER